MTLFCVRAQEKNEKMEIVGDFPKQEGFSHLALDSCVNFGAVQFCQIKYSVAREL